MKKYKGQWIAAAVGFVLCLIGIFMRRGDLDGTTRSLMKVLSDGVLLGGAVLTVLGVFVIAIRGGVFDGIAYGASKLRKRTQGESVDREKDTYFDYVNRQRSGKKSSVLLVPGLCYIAIAVIFVIIYYQV